MVPPRRPRDLSQPGHHGRKRAIFIHDDLELGTVFWRHLDSEVTKEMSSTTLLPHVSKYSRPGGGDELQFGISCGYGMALIE